MSPPSYNGRVSISWAVSEDHPPRFKLHWKEHGGPPVQEPSRKSFGSRLIEQALPGQLQGEARLRFEPDGLSCGGKHSAECYAGAASRGCALSINTACPAALRDRLFRN